MNPQSGMKYSALWAYPYLVAEEVAQAQTSKTNTLTMSQQQFNKQANESHLAGGRYHMPIDTAEFAAKCKGGGFHGGLVEMNNCDYGANAHWKAPACPFDISDLLGDEAPKKVEAPKVEETAKAEEVAQAETSKTNNLTMSQQQFNKQANESHLAGGRYHMPIDTAE